MEKLFIIVRGDLTPGQQLSQSIHASIGFVKKFKHDDWFEESNTIVCLSVKNEMELLEFERKLLKNDLKYFKFQEPDMKNEHTSIAFIAMKPTVTRKLPLALSMI